MCVRRPIWFCILVAFYLCKSIVRAKMYFTQSFMQVVQYFTVRGLYVMTVLKRSYS